MTKYANTIYVPIYISKIAYIQDIFDHVENPIFDFRERKCFIQNINYLEKCT